MPRAREVIDPPASLLESFPCCPFVAWWSRSAGRPSSTCPSRCARATRSGSSGRNGAGQDHAASRCSAAPTAPKSRRGPAGGGHRLPVPGPPPRRRPRRHQLPRPRALGSGARRGAPTGSRSCGSRSRRTRPTANIDRFSDAQERFEADGGYAAESEVRKLVDGLGLRRRPPRPHPRRAVGWRAPPARAGPHPLRRQRAAAARRAHQPPRRRRPRLAAQVPARLPRRAARRQPRPRPARRGDHPRGPPRPRGGGGRRRARRVQGHVLAVPRRRASATRSASRKLAERQAREIARLIDAGRPDARADRQAGPGGQEPRRPGPSDRRPTQVEGPAKRRTLALQLPRAAAVRPHGAHRHRAVEGLRRARRLRRRQLRRRPRRAAARHGPQRRRQDHAAQDPGRPRSSPTSARSSSGTHVSAGYYAQEHEGIVAGATLLEHMREASDAGRRGAARPARHVRPERRQGVPGRRHALGRREDQARAGPARRRPPQPAAARRAHQQPRSRRRAPRPARRSRRGPAR